MTPILSETRERLLKTIVAQVPPERITEIHFFAPIKQGGVESGVAVVAAMPEALAAPESVVGETAGADEEAEEQGSAEGAADLPVEDAASEGVEAESDESAEASAEETADESAEESVDQGIGQTAEENGDIVAETPVDAAVGDEDVGTPDAAPAATSSQRHVIYTARYRYTLKGPDRGKWETNVKAEADAPLITVETVVRGVQRRVGDVEEPERMTGDDIRAITRTWASAAAAAALPGNAPATR